ncbi:MAG: DUF763 domain-containing protein [Candidatus Wildermuthbacteria bacterium]|nr:DUF763 domain-containing protein [Candidatus Wildermuthbacteria bacterium]
MVQEPHSGITSQEFGDRVLNLVSKDSAENRNISSQLVNASYDTLLKDLQLLRRHMGPVSSMVSVKNGRGEQLTLANFNRIEFKHHVVEQENFSKSKYLERIFAKVTYQKPQNYEQLVALEGVGPKTIRALALVAELIYGAETSYEDPARYSFAHGGKDATPYPVDRKTYDQTISTLQNAVRRTQLAPSEKDKALRRLSV